jgi:hypothetical protein
MQWYLGIYLGYKIYGIWIAKLILDVYVFFGFNLMILFSDWNHISKQAISK